MTDRDSEENTQPDSLPNDSGISETTPLFGDQHRNHLLNSPAEKSLRTRKRLTFAAFALTYFTMSASYSVIAPFFPTEAKEKGANGYVVGFIFGILALVNFIFSPVMGVLLPVVGVRFMFFAGLFSMGVAEFLFGFLNKMPDGTVFITFSFILRVFDGVSSAAAVTAAVAFLAQCFPDNTGSVMGGLELFTGVGLTMGPLVGGVLYEYGGFGLPFFVLAGLMLVTLPVTMCILPDVPDANVPSDDPSSGATLAKLLKIPEFDIIVCTIVVGGMAIGIVEPTLAPHLKNQFHVTSSTKIGIIFFFFCASYALCAPLFGFVSDKTNPRWVMTAGCFFCGIGFLLLGPVPLPFMPNEVWFLCVSMFVIGLSLGPLFVPAISEMEHIVKKRGFPDDLTTHGIISGIYGAAFNIGAFFGPSLSGVFTEYLHFSWTCTGFGVILLVQTVFLLGLALSGNSTPPDDPKHSTLPSQGNSLSPNADKLRTVQA